jgi:ATP-dependent RNA helicase UAP56/SUB2
MNMDNIPDYDDHSSDDDQKPPPNKSGKPGEFGTNLTGWNELFLKDDLKRGIRECGFEHPSEVQANAIPPALQSQDILCQAKSGMGKTAVFVIAILHQLQVGKNGQY